MPNLKKFLKKGVHGDLESTIPPLTYPAWISIATGKNPGKTGIFHFSSKVEGEYGKRIMGNPRNDEIWKILSSKKKKVCVVNVPGTYPPSKVNGIMVTGMLTPSGRDYTYPKSLQTELDEMDYDVDVDQAGEWGNLDENTKIDRVFETTRKRKEAVKNFLREKDWDFFMVVFTGTDRLQHFFWKYLDRSNPHYKKSKYEERIMEYFSEIDLMLKELIDSAGKDTTICIISDHGFGPFNKSVHLNIWLEQNGFLKMKKKRSALGSVGFTRSRIGNFLVRTGLEKLIPLVPKRVIETVPRSKIGEFPDIDWENTKAYSLTIESIFINLKGREPNGIVSKKEYEKLRNEISKKLKQLKDPETGKKVVKKVYKKEEIYSGENMDKIPDLLVETHDGYLSCENFSDMIFKSSWMSGNHKRNGILFMCGADIKKGKIKARVYDISPTILHIMGMPIPSDMDGKVLKVFKKGSKVSRRKVKHEKVIGERKKHFEFSKEDEEKIKERLRSLGYMG